MIQARIDSKEKLVALEASGDPIRIAAEFASIACNTYAILKQTSEETASTFKDTLLFLLSGNGMAWDTENATAADRGVCTIASSEPIENTEQ